MVGQEENLLNFFSEFLTRSFFISVDIFSPVHFAY